MKYVLVTLLLVGCANTPGNMTPEQMTANAKDKNASAVCGNVFGVWGNGSSTYVNVDEAAKVGGRVEVTANKDGCTTIVDTTPVSPTPKEGK